ncbi:N-acetylglucosamine kinase [Telluria aromaticivorans]|uniref:ATPase n=1 Tax=Telluria aromaticivorans TaxID=2725995 RepID=A0A7Y2P165_9BURK|nr:BadF/BadG/BcrA/BcrD ATPase family protein [Telluria aromaticivorans]NNG24928.1 ATPase [Telluria aromaticivorans]
MHNSEQQQEGLGLGIDAGGTQTRWALAAPGGRIVAEGTAPGLSALQMGSAEGRESVQAAFAGIASAVLAQGRPAAVRAGLTGFGGESDQLQQWLGGLLGLAPGAVAFSNDIEIAYLASFKPGEGYLVYSGTGSIGAFIDDRGGFHRAGGRGVVLDDGGGGFWIAREALRHIWRLEDERPGAWEESPMAHAVFQHVGGSDWSFSRQFIYGRERGEVGKLAIAVAATAERDPAAAAILREAGTELARLALALIRRFGPRPVALAGRAAELHPAIVETMRAALPPDATLSQTGLRAHYAAARLAAAPNQ